MKNIFHERGTKAMWQHSREECLPWEGGESCIEQVTFELNLDEWVGAC